MRPGTHTGAWSWARSRLCNLIPMQTDCAQSQVDVGSVGLAQHSLRCPNARAGLRVPCALVGLSCQRTMMRLLYALS